MKTKLKSLSIVMGLTVALTGFSGGAGAAGFQLLEQNASGLGNAFAGTAAVAEDASTIFFNPASSFCEIPRCGFIDSLSWGCGYQ